MPRTTMNFRLNHVAFLVPSVERSAALLASAGFEVGTPQVFPGEGTKEVYVGHEALGARLLLLEAVDDGPYLRTWRKRGAGLHHVAIDVKSHDAFLEEISDSGWLVHPRSIGMMRRGGALFLARPGIGTLIEVNLGNERSGAVIENVQVPCAPHLVTCLQSLAIEGLTPGTEAAVRMSGQTWTWEALAGRHPVAEQILAWLAERKIEFREHRHRPAATCEEAAAFRGSALAAGAKTLLVKAGEKFRLVTLSAADELDSRLLRQALGTQKLRFATREELRAMVGVEPGAVAPVPVNGLPLVVDEDLLHQPTLSFNIGETIHSITMATEDFVRNVSFERAKITGERSPEQRVQV